MRLRSALVLAIVVLLLSTVLVVAGSAWFNARRAATELTNEVLEQATERIERVVRAQLDVASSESALMRARMTRGDLRTDDLDAIAAYATDVLSTHPSLSYVSFGREATGELAQASRDSKGSLWVRFLRRTSDGLTLSDLAPEPGGLRLVRSEPHKDGNSPRLRPYYAAARDAKRPVWTETYPFFGAGDELGAPGVTYATPVYGGDGALLGVTTADFDLRATSQLLKNLSLFDHGSAFIVEYRKDGSRRVVAHASAELVSPPGKDGKPALAAVSLEEIGDPAAVAFGKLLPKGLPPRGEVLPVAFDGAGARFVGAYRAIGDSGVPWVVCAFVPEEDILGEVHRHERTTAVVAAIGTAFAVLVALWFGAAIAGPLRAVADETLAIGQFRLGLRAPVKTGVLEVARLAHAVEEMKRNLRSFQKYVPADLVRELVAKGEEAQLGGRRATLTIHFSDIAGFTSIAETTSPENLVMMLSEYLDEMTKPILASGGTVDKFIGDAIMAFWGAPRADDAHALHACEAALANRARLAVLNEAWEKAGRPRLDARAALHTGEVIVGNVGSRERLDYTVIGDSVNLASRLEGLNKQYGTSLMISEATYAAVQDVMVVRPLDRVSVKGKAKPVTVYELIGKKGDVPPDLARRAERHAEAFALYVARRFSEAAAIFDELSEGSEKDVAARVLLARCHAFVATPPDADWDGAEHMKTK